MSRTQRLVLLSLLLLCGCRGGPVQQETDRVLLELASRPFDVAPPLRQEKSEEKGSQNAKSEEKQTLLQTSHSASAGQPETDILTVSLLQAGTAQERQSGGRPRYELKVPPGLPGAEAPRLPDFKNLTKEQQERTIRQIYPELPSLPEEPAPQSGPNGQAYTLADLQKLAVENSPTLRQAVSDVKNAEGALVQAKTYQNPTVAYQASPTNNNSNAGAQGGYIDQPLRMWGKMKLGIAAAQKDLDNAQLALRRARSDLSTNVRNAYFGLIVAQETMRVNRALSRFTDEIYRLFTSYAGAGIVAPYEPAPLRAQAFTNRLAYQQAIYGYIATWKQLVATLGISQLPLTEVAGRVDQLIPYYDYDKVLAHVLANHTDALTARNGVQKAQYSLKLAQMTPYPDVDILGAVWKESTIPPYAIFYQAQVVLPVPIWDRNKGNIISAQSAMIRAVEETHRVENALTNALAMNYANYQNNLKALEYYRRWILPDQVRYYRGVFERRQADPAVAALPPADLVTAQQGLATAVQTYLGILGSLWTSVVSVADMIQTPDLFQRELAIGRELPALPNLDQIPNWLCPHQRLAGGPPGACAPGPLVKPVPVPAGGATPMLPPADDPVLPAPQKAGDTPVVPQAKPAELNQQLLEPPPEIPKKSKDDDGGESEPRESASGEASAP
jgi:cobalt-zinc-cadmium efflux system outer membrane protein